MPTREARNSVMRAPLKRGYRKIMSWYDNEWGYANQMLRTALALTGAR